MKITKEFILLLIVTILLIVNLFNLNSVNTNVKNYESKIKKVQIEIDSLDKINTRIYKKIDSVNAEVNYITNKIEKVDKTITIVKNNTNEKINNVNNFGLNELELFFANRYGKN